MHELLTGRPPFPYQDVPRVIRAICSERYHLPERQDIPDELFEILFQCLRKDRKERFQDVEELARAFQPLVRSASAQVSLERILRTRNGAPPPVRVTPIPEPSLVSTEPDLPSVTPMERDTPPAVPKRPAFMVGVRAGVLVGVVWTAFVLGQRLAHDERLATAPAPGVNAPVVAAPNPPSAIATSAPQTNAPPVSIPPVAAPVATAVAPVSARVVATSPARRVRRSTASSQLPALPQPDPASAAAPVPPGPQRDPWRKLRPLDMENPFVTSR